MILDLDHNLLFIHNAKTGGTSIKRLLQPLDKWDHQIPVYEHGARIMGSTPGHGHATLWMAYGIYEQLREGPDPVHFGVVRNPWDRAHSLYTWEGMPESRVHHDVKDLTFKQWMVDYKQWHDPGRRHLQEHQWWYFSTDPAVYCPTPRVQILRFEDLDRGWARISKLIRHAKVRDTLPRARPSGPPGDYLEAYRRHPECVDIVAKNFWADIEIFGYRDQKPA